MRHTIQELREDRAESRDDLATAIGVTADEVADWWMGRTEPTVSRLRVLTEHFSVRDDQINLRPHDPPSFGDRVVEVL